MKIGIVNDMPMAVEALRRTLAASPEHQIVWVAENGAVAVAHAVQQTPDLILMDLIMPVMDGVEATRRIMEVAPCNILVVTSSVGVNSAKVFEAMGAGALDVVATPVLDRNGNGAANGHNLLLKKIGQIARISGLGGPHETMAPPLPAKTKVRTQKNCLIVIGSSTGGPQAVLEILTGLPRDLPAAIVVVQHMDEKFSGGFTTWLNSQVALSVRGLKEGDQPEPGVVLIPSTRDHVVMFPDNSFGYSTEPEGNFYHPSVDVFFESVARNWSGSCIGVILTGMGRDGAQGLLSLRRHGHYTIAQDRESCTVFGMPKTAIEIGAAAEVLPLSAVAGALVDLIGSRQRKASC